MKRYSPSKIEPKWQKFWEKKGLHKTDFSPTSPRLRGARKFYSLVMFPYPSADKLHIGHWYNFGPADTYARFKKLQGFNIFEPMGFDSFGLPAENYAIKAGVHPKKSTQENINFIRKQLKQIGTMYDFSREIITSKPSYYKWTQWLFLRLYKSGFAYRKLAPANYCPSCKTVLANEQVLDGRCERCSIEVTQKNLPQWFFKITKYAEKLLKGLDKLDWPEKTKLMQKNWIGKSEGAVISFRIKNSELRIKQIEVFTTRPDTLFGATYIILAPEKWQELNVKLQSKIQNYLAQTKRTTYFEREVRKDKTGVFTGLYAINPINDEKIPIWIADYVLPDYGTGAIMCVPAHDQRDFEFAKKYKLPIKEVIKSPKDIKNKAYEGGGKVINSGKWNGLDSEKFKDEIVRWLEKRDLGKKIVNYKLRDWLISRQRYWGAPIPIVYCQKCGTTPVPEKDLPLLLPEDVDFKPTGESPLATSENFVNIKCPKCGQKAKRETDTMDTFVCSSWYYLRYLTPHLKDKPFDKNLIKKWLPVDIYIGGAEHSTMHLIYARFFGYALNDLGLIPFQEPFPKLRHQGVITYQGAKMSKSKGNVVVPDEFIKHYGADTFRMYLMFMGPYDQGGDWSDKGINGLFRFLNRVWDAINVKCQMSNVKTTPNSKIQKKLHKTIKKVTGDLEELKFNTAIASLMEWQNIAISEKQQVTREDIEVFLKLLSPFAPHLAEELWAKLGYKNSIFLEKWPKYDPNLIKEEKIILVVQVNGKVRDKIEILADQTEKDIKNIGINSPKIKKWITGKRIKRIIYIPNKLVNIVIDA